MDCIGTKKLAYLGPFFGSPRATASLALRYHFDEAEKFQRHLVVERKMAAA